MNPENQNNIVEKKQLIALAAILFLAPAIKPTIEANKIDIAEEDKPFIESYLVYGKYILYVLGSSLFMLIVGKIVFGKTIFVNIAEALSALVILMVFVGELGIFRKKQIVIDKRISRNNIVSLVWKNKKTF